MEEWKNIIGYEGLYKVSSYGRVKSLGNGKSNNSKQKLLKLVSDKDGYLQVGLFKDGKEKRCKVHRLVAKAFLENPNNLPQVNHKDENKENNCVDNLEWCTAQYNNNYGTRTEKTSKQVYQYSLQGELIKIWDSTQECGRNGFHRGNIASCCRGEYKTSQGFIWKYN